MDFACLDSIVSPHASAGRISGAPPQDLPERRQRENGLSSLSTRPCDCSVRVVVRAAVAVTLERALHEVAWEVRVRGWNLAHPRQREPARGAELVHRRPSRCRSSGLWSLDLPSAEPLQHRPTESIARVAGTASTVSVAAVPDAAVLDPLSRAMVDSAVSRGARSFLWQVAKAPSRVDHRPEEPQRTSSIGNSCCGNDSPRAHEAGRLGPLLLTAGNAWASPGRPDQLCRP